MCFRRNGTAFWRTPGWVMPVPGLFADWQPKYAARGIATFPVRDKKPAVKNYLKAGLGASKEFARKFASHSAFGIACRRSKITVLDVDAPDEKLLADAMSEFGATPFVVRSGSGNFQAWYRSSGEGRRIRPDPHRPIDILGDGYVVAPPSVTTKGAYQIIAGSLDDLASLPTMNNIRPDTSPSKLNDVLIQEGYRNEELWRYCMRTARDCDDQTELTELAVQANRTMFYKPLSHAEVLKVVQSAWGKQTRGENWFGSKGRVVFEGEEVEELLKGNEDALILLAIIRHVHWGRDFVLANAMAETMPGEGWAVKRFRAARAYLLKAGFIEEIKPASRWKGAAVYRLKGGRN